MAFTEHAELEMSLHPYRLRVLPSDSMTLPIGSVTGSRLAEIISAIRGFFL